jgi:hypothetical protein
MAKTQSKHGVPASAPKLVTIDVTPPAEAREGVALVTTARHLVVTDKETHRVALEFIRGAKQLKRKIEEHWSRITRTVDEQKRTLLTLKREDLEPVETALSIAERVAVDYQNAEDRRVREEEDRRRVEAEAQAQRDREAELQRAEAAALKLEESDELSNREQVFVQAKVDGLDDFKAASRAGYAQPRSAAERLMKTAKILTAISNAQSALAIRQQAEAKRRQPLDIISRPVERQTAKVSGVRANLTYWSCSPAIDVDKLIDGVIAGTVDRRALMPNQVFLNQQAEQLHEAFNAAYPGCSFVKRQSIGG